MAQLFMKHFGDDTNSKQAIFSKKKKKKRKRELRSIQYEITYIYFFKKKFITDLYAVNHCQ